MDTNHTNDTNDSVPERADHNGEMQNHRFVSMLSGCGKMFEIFDAQTCTIIATAKDEKWAVAIAQNMSAVHRMKNILTGLKQK